MCVVSSTFMCVRACLYVTIQSDSLYDFVLFLNAIQKFFLPGINVADEERERTKEKKKRNSSKLNRFNCTLWCEWSILWARKKENILVFECALNNPLSSTNLGTRRKHRIRTTDYDDATADKQVMIDWC